MTREVLCFIKEVFVLPTLVASSVVFILLCTSIVVVAQPSNDDCINAIELFSPCNPVVGTIEDATDSGINDCPGNSNNDVWYYFIANAESYEIEVDGFGNFIFGFDAVIGVYTGDCNNLSNVDCEDGSFFGGATEDLTLTGLTIGQTYYIQVYDFDNSDPSNEGFDICIEEIVGDCGQSNVQATILSCTNCTINDGSAQGNQFGDPNLEVTANGCGPVTILLEYSFDWTQGSGNNWIHGISYTAGPAWTGFEDFTPPGWIFMPNGVTGSCSGDSYGPGYYYDTPQNDDSSCGGDVDDSNPGDNWGVDCGLDSNDGDCPNFQFELTYCTNNSTPTQFTESVSFSVTEDGASGGWDINGFCNLENFFNVTINSVCGPQADFADPPVDFCTAPNFDLMNSTGGYDIGTEWTGSVVIGAGDPNASMSYCDNIGNTTLFHTVGENDCYDGPSVQSYEVYEPEIQNVMVSATEGCGDTEVMLSADVDIVNIAGFQDWFTTVSEGGNTGAGTLEFVDQDGATYVPGMITLTAEACEEKIYTLTPQLNTGCAACDVVGPPIMVTVYPSFTLDLLPMAECGTAYAHVLGTDGTICDMVEVNCPNPGDIASAAYDFMEAVGTACVLDVNGMIECSCYICNADAGTVDPVPPTCLDDIFTVTVSGYFDDPDYVEYVLVVDDSGVIIEFGPPPYDFAASVCEDYSFYSYNYDSNDPLVVLPMAGTTIVNDIDCTVACCDLTGPVVQTFGETGSVMLNVPPDVTVECDVIPTEDGSGASISGNTCPVDLVFDGETIDPGSCQYDYTATYQWTATDECGNVIVEDYTITVEDTTPPTFDNPPTPVPDILCGGVLPPQETLTGSDNCGTVMITESASPFTPDDCAGYSVTYTWDIEDECSNSDQTSLTITILGDPDPPLLIVPNDIVVSCELIPSEDGSSATATDNCTEDDDIVIIYQGETDNSASGCPYEIIRTWNAVDLCGNDTGPITQTINVQDTELPIIENVPPDLTLNCISEFDITIQDLNWTDNCALGGIAIGVQDPVDVTVFNCAGGTITRTWEVTDDCDNTTTEIQTITIEPYPEVMWVNPPGPVVLSCSDPIPSIDPNDYPLGYASSGTGCTETGTVNPSIIGMITTCNTTMTLEWTYTDMEGCSTITHSQVYTLIDADSPELQNEPADITYDCFADLPPMTNLDWIDTCDGTSTAIGVENGTITNCEGGNITRTWVAIDACGNQDSHTQNITVLPVPDITWTTSLPPAQISIECMIPLVIPDAIDLDYANNATVIDCEESGTVNAVESGALTTCGSQLVRTWTTPNPDCGPPLVFIQTLTLEDTSPPVFINTPPPALNLTCINDVPTTVDLTWEDTCDGTGTVPYVETGSLDPCTGGSISRTWEYTDICGNGPVQFVQVISLVPPTPMACDDIDACTINDMLIVDCNGTICQPCQGEVTDCSGETELVACDDIDPCTINDVIELACDGTICTPCQGEVTDCDTGLTFQEPCSDDDPCTINDMRTIDCQNQICIPCTGTPNPTPDPSLSGPSLVCEGEQTTLSATGCAGDVIWYDDPLGTNIINIGPTFDTPVITGPVTFYAICDVDGCESNLVSIALDIIQPQLPTVTGDDVICKDELSILDAGPGFVSYDWGTGTGQTLTVTMSGTYTVTVTDSNGCVSTDDFTVQVIDPQIPNIGGSLTYCIGGSTTLSLGTDFVDYIWNPNGETTNSIDVSVSGTYSVTTTDSNGCTASSSVQISESSTLDPQIIGSLVLCENEASVLSVGSFSTYTWSPGGETTASININASGTYSVLVTDSNGCTGTSSVNIIDNDISPVMIVGDDLICEGTSTTLDAFGIDYTNYQWSNGSVNSSVSVMDDIDYTVQVTDINGCTSSSTISIDYYPTTALVIEGDLIICPGQSTTLSSQSVYDQYSWSPGGETTSSILVGSAGTYVLEVTDNNGCTLSSSVNVTSQSDLQVFIQGSLSYCVGSSTELDAGNWTSYQWSPNGEISQVITANAEGNYSVQVTDDNGCQFSSTVNVIEDSELSPTIYGDFLTCENSEVEIFVLSASYSNIVWSDNTVGDFIFVGPGTYTVTVTDNTGCTGSSTVTVTEQEVSDVSISGLTEICQGNTTELVADAGFDDYVWSNGLTSESIIVNVSGVYDVTVTDDVGCTASSEVLVEVSTITQPNIIGDTQLCATGSTNLSVSGYSSYLWSTGETNANIEATSPGSYSVVVTDIFGCTNSSSISIIENSLPSVQIQGSNSYCLGGFTELSVDNGFDSILWSTGQTTPTIQVMQEGVVEVVVTDINGCSASSMVAIVESTELSPTISGILTVCQGGLTTLIADGNYPMVEWSTSESTESIEVGEGDYTVTVTDNSGCTGSSEVTVSSQQAADVSISGDNEFCEGFTTQLDASSGFVLYQWTGGVMGATLTVTSSGMYGITATDAIGCTATSSIQVNSVSLNPPTILGDTLFCEDSVTTLDGGQYASYSWSTTETTPSIMVNESGQIALTVTDDNGCTNSTAVIVQAQALPEPVIVGSTSFCLGGSASLNLDQSYVSVLWSTGESTPTITTSDIGTISVIVTDVIGCTGSSEVMISLEEFLSPNIGGDLEFCSGETSTLDGGGAFETWVWSTTETTQTIDVTQAGSYSVTVSDATGCTGSSEVVVTTLQNPEPTITGQLELCLNQTTTLGVSEEYTSYSWSDGEISDTTLVSIAGTYSVMVTDSLGCVGSSQVDVVIYQLPMVGIETVCDPTMQFYSVVVNTDGDIVTAGANTVTNTNGQFVIDNIETDTSVEVYIQNSATSCDTTINVLPPNCDCLAIADAGSNQEINCDEPSTLLGGQDTSIGSGFSYIWYNEDGDIVGNEITYTASLGGIYTLEVVDESNACSTSSTVEVIDTSNEPIAIIYAQPDNVIDCVVDVVTLSTDAQTNVEYTWIVGKLETTNNLQIEITEQSSVTLMAVDTITGCSAESSVFIEDQEEYPLLLIGNPDILTCINTAITIDASGSQSGVDIVYQWYDESGPIDLENGNTLDVFLDGTYFIQAIDTTNNCTNIDSVEVVLVENFPSISASEDTILPCDQDEINLNVNLTSSETVLYSWTTEDGNILGNTNDTSVAVNASGWYYVVVEDALSGCTTIDSVFVDGNVPPSLAEQDIIQPICANPEGGEIVVNLSSGGTPPLTYSIGDDQNSTGVFTGLGPGSYTVQVVDALGCSADTTLVLESLNEVELGVDEPSINSTYGGTETIELITNVPESEIAEVQWSPVLPFDCINCLTLTFENITMSQEYLVTLIDIEGCLDTTFFQFIIEQEEDIFVPNIVNPNNDVNNTFYPLSGTDGVIVKQMQVYDRWGNLVFIGSDFETNDPQFGWDGTFNGVQVEAGVYVYYFEFDFPGLGSIVKAGDVTVVF